jgi:hypothetical protein
MKPVVALGLTVMKPPILMRWPVMKSGVFVGTAERAQPMEPLMLASLAVVKPLFGMFLVMMIMTVHLPFEMAVPVMGRAQDKDSGVMRGGRRMITVLTEADTEVEASVRAGNAGTEQKQTEEDCLFHNSITVEVFCDT